MDTQFMKKGYYKTVVEEQSFQEITLKNLEIFMRKYNANSLSCIMHIKTVSGGL